MRDDDRNISARHDERIWPAQLNPVHLEHFPLLNGTLGPFESIRPLAQLDSIVVGGVRVRRFMPRRSDLLIGKFLILLSGEEHINGLLKRSRRAEHMLGFAPRGDPNAFSMAGIRHPHPPPDKATTPFPG